MQMKSYKFTAFLIINIVALVLSLVLVPFAVPAEVTQDGHDHDAHGGGGTEYWMLAVKFEGTAGADEPYMNEGEEIGRYNFYPDTIRVKQGEEVKMVFFGIHSSDAHEVTIEYYQPTSFFLRHNQMVNRTFTADKAGIFKIQCGTYGPIMEAYLIVEDGTTETTLSDNSVHFWVLGVEFKGIAGENEPYLDPGDKVAHYMFYPSTIRVKKGQNVTLSFLGVNGDEHETSIEYYAPTEFEFYRNQTVTKNFIADKSGFFKIDCEYHGPTMEAYLIVEDGITETTPPGDSVEAWILGAEFNGTAGPGEPYINAGDHVAAYISIPDTIRVKKGQKVTLNFLGVHGPDGHLTSIENYVETEFVYYRNQTVTKTFTANTPGVFRIHCHDHQPYMNSFLIVEGEPDISTDFVAPLPVDVVFLAFIYLGLGTIIHTRQRR